MDRAKVTIEHTDLFAEAMQRMREDGLLMVTQGADGAPNVMTIGWGTIGAIWGRSVFVALVRPSRYTYSRLEENGDFTVNVPTTDLNDAVSYCGTVSGRDKDKFAEMNLTAVPGKQVGAPIIEECVIHYECRTLHRNDLIPEMLVRDVQETAYPHGDYHRVYFGQILAAYADEDAARRLGK